MKKTNLKDTAARVAVKAMLLICFAGTGVKAQNCPDCREYYPSTYWPAFTSYPLQIQQGQMESSGVDAPEARLLSGSSTHLSGMAFDGENVFFRFCLAGNPAGDGGFAAVNYLVAIADEQGKHLMTVGLNGKDAADDYVYVIAPNQLFEQRVYVQSEYPEMARIIKNEGSYYLDFQLPLCVMNIVYCLHVGAGKRITPTMNLRYVAGTSNAKHIVNRSFLTGRNTNFSFCSPVSLLMIQKGSTATDAIRFNAKRSPSTILLEWQTSNIDYEDSFEIERSFDGVLWKHVNSIPGYAAVSSNNIYTYNDPILPDFYRNGRAVYRIKQHATEGNTIVSQTLMINFSRQPKMELSQNYPNPFNPYTNISFQLPRSQKVTMHVFNTMGQEVARPIDNVSLEDGEHTITFSADGIPAGQYIYRLVTDAGSLNRSMYIMK